MASAALLGAIGLGGAWKAAIDRRKRRDELGFEESQSVIEALRGEIAALRTEASAARAEHREEMQALRTEHRTEIEGLERKLAESQAEQAKLSAAVLALQTAVLDSQSEKQQLTFQLQQRDALIAEKDRTIERLVKENTDANSIRVDLEVNYAKANGRIQMLTQEVNRLRELAK